MKAYLYLLIIILTLTSCAKSTPEIEAARNASFPEDIFRDELRMGYIKMSDEEWKKGDKGDARRYGRKATVLVNNIEPEMDGLFDRNIPLKQLNALLGAKYFVESAFASGVRETEPEISAQIQLTFDCWADQQEEKNKKIRANKCRDDFTKLRPMLAEALAEIKNKERDRKMQLEAAREQSFRMKLAEQKARMRKMRKMPEPSLIFFKYNSVKLGVTGKNILKKVAKDILLFKPRKVIISGNADKTGSYEYNMKLAMKRGQTIADYLTNHFNVKPDILDVKAYGENSPRETARAKTVRNRYVRIEFKKYNKFYYE